MAYVPEEATWPEGIYQLERSDPVLGGPGGVSNWNIRDLACRTVWLRQTVEQLTAQVGDTDSDIYTRLTAVDDSLMDIYSQILGLQRNVVNLYGMMDDVEEIIEDFNTPKQTTMVLTAPMAAGRSITIPDGIRYHYGSKTLSVFWQGVKCAEGLQYEEGIADSDGYAGTIITLFPMKEGSLLEFVVAGHTTKTIDQDGGDPDGYIEDIISRLAAMEAAIIEIQQQLTMRDAAEIFEETLEEK